MDNMRYIIQKHSFIDIITNSSMETYLLDTTKSLEMVKLLVEEKCKEYDEMRWFNSECKIYLNENNKIEIYSFLNMDDKIRDFIEVVLEGTEI